MTPTVVVVNLWYDYDDINLEKEILTPTPEFVEKCYAKKDTFIGNHECLPCRIKESVISTKEECNRCPNLVWKNFECL